MKVSKLKPNPNNPRLVKDNRFALLVKSIQELPKMMPLAPIIVDENFMVLSGNMRLKAIQHLGMKEIPDDWVVQDKNLTEDEKKRIVIAANVSFGEMDWDVIKSDWSTEPIEEWGLELPNFDDGILPDAFTLKDGEKAPFQQMTFTLADVQAETIKRALKVVSLNGETFGNENGNGNRLHEIVSQWEKQSR